MLTTEYDARLRRGQIEHGSKWNPASLDAAKQFARYYHGPRIKVQRDYGDGETWTRTGTVSSTTGWMPSFMLMYRSNSMGSSDLLGPEDKIIAVQHTPGGKYTEVTS
jgi:hypothetical protein